MTRYDYPERIRQDFVADSYFISTIKLSESRFETIVVSQGPDGEYKWAEPHVQTAGSMASARAMHERTVNDIMKELGAKDTSVVENVYLHPSF